MNPELLNEIALRYGTPCYLFDTDHLRSRVLAIRDRLDQSADLCYAMKANPFLTGAMAACTDRIEVCSPGEMKICISQNIPADKILLSGVNKSDPDIREALSYGVRNFTAESEKQMDLLKQAADKEGITIRVFLRLCAGSQFGMDPSVIKRILQERSLYTSCIFAGLHYFAGTQRKTSRNQISDIRKIAAFLADLEKTCSYIPEELEYGPGLYVPYFEGEEDDTMHCVSQLSSLLSENIPPQIHVTIEMGRYFSASCGWYLSRVCDRKVNEGHRYLILDGGIHHLNYYGGMMGMRVPGLIHLRKGENTSDYEAGQGPEIKEWSLCGSLCTVADVLVRSVLLTDPQTGDLFAFKNTGAYSVTESSALFLSRDMPKIIILSDGKTRLVRDTIDTFPFNMIASR